MSDNLPKTIELDRSIGLVGATALVVGAVVGGGIFILITDIALQTGDSLWLSFFLAMTVSLIGVIPVIQLAGSLPRAGGGYFFTSRLLSPYLGVLVSSCIIFAGASSTALVSLQFAKLSLPYFSDGVINAFDKIGGVVIFGQHFMNTDVAPSESVIAVLVAVLFYGIFLFGLQLAMSIQVIFSIQFVIALGIYALVGLFTVETKMSFTSPLGVGGMVTGFLLCYSTCFGLQIVAELGEEIKNARRNIPLSLLIGCGIVTFLYIAVGQVFVSVEPNPETYAAMKIPLKESAERFLPGWMIPMLTLGAFTAALTSLNAGAIGIPREIFAQARDGIAPAIFGKIHGRTRAPQHAVALFFALTVLLIFLGMDVDYYGLVAAIGILILSSMLCVASLFLPRMYPERYRSAYIVFPVPVLWLCTIITVLVSIGMTAALLLEQPGIIGVYAVWCIFISAYYFWRTRSFTPEQWKRLRDIGSHEETVTK